MAKSDARNKGGARDAGGDEPPARSGRNGPAKLAIQVNTTARAVAAGRGFALLSVASRWRDIAGAALANHTQPMSLSTGGILTLKADGGAALLVQHQSREIVGRVNAVLGEGAVASIKLVQGVVERGRQSAPKPPPPRVSAEDEASVTAALERIADPALREQLARLMRRSLSAPKRR